MFEIKEDLSINITRGDAAELSFGANIGATSYEFKIGDVVRFRVFVKKDCEEVVLQKDVEITTPTSEAKISLTGQDTEIGKVISKPVEYWYDVKLNPETYPQTIIGYDDNGAKVFKLFPGGGVANE